MMYKLSLFALLLIVSFSCDNEALQQLQQEKDQLTQTLEESKAQIAELELQTQAPGLIHSVFFWLKEDLSDADQEAFLAGVAQLESITSVKQMHVGPPAPTEARDVVDNSYSIALLIHFDDLAGQDAYQIDPIHLKFVEEQKDKWTKVVVFDSMITE